MAFPSIASTDLEIHPLLFLGPDLVEEKPAKQIAHRLVFNDKPPTTPRWVSFNTAAFLHIDVWFMKT